MNATAMITCVKGYKQISLGVPVQLALILTVPVSIIGTILNGFALILLSRQKQFTNQDIYVSTLSIFGMIMAGPCLFLFTYGNVRMCYDFPQIISDLRIFLVQFSAGVSIWLVVMISIDRLLMVYYALEYQNRVTKKATLIGIGVLIVFYLFVCGLIDFSPYFMQVYKMDPFSLHPEYVMRASFIETPTVISYVLNMIRMLTDRTLPWILCTCVYVSIFVIRTGQRRRVMVNSRPSVQKKPARSTQQWSSQSQSRPSLGRIGDEERMERSRNLVIGITVSLLICLAPETVFDISSYVFGVVLRKGVWEILGVVWYFQTISNPLIYIASFPKLSQKCSRMMEKAIDTVTGRWPCKKPAAKPKKKFKWPRLLLMPELKK